MSTKSKARAARRASERQEHAEDGTSLDERERAVAAELGRALLSMITLGAVSDDGPASSRRLATAS
jgi:hypothetical protein